MVLWNMHSWYLYSRWRTRLVRTEYVGVRRERHRQNKLDVVYPVIGYRILDTRSFRALSFTRFNIIVTRCTTADVRAVVCTYARFSHLTSVRVIGAPSNYVSITTSKIIILNKCEACTSNYIPPLDFSLRVGSNCAKLPTKHELF